MEVSYACINGISRSYILRENTSASERQKTVIISVHIYSLCKSGKNVKAIVTFLQIQYHANLLESKGVQSAIDLSSSNRLSQIRRSVSCIGITHERWFMDTSKPVLSAVHTQLYTSLSYSTYEFSSCEGLFDLIDYQRKKKKKILEREKKGISEPLIFSCI